MKDHISVNGHDGTFAAYVATPKTSPAPAVIVLQELFGVNADIRKHCDELAEQGFIAVAPDLFWRQEPGIDLSVIVVRLISDLIAWVGIGFRQRKSLQAEVLFLRRQLALYVERGVKPRRIDAATRVSLA